MKNYTNLEQSQKLAEILPVESADAWWAERYEGKVTYDGQYIVNEEPFYYISFIKPSEINYSQDTVKDIPCWSLAALIEALPLGTDIHNITDGHKIYYYVEIYTKEICMKLKRMNKAEICLSSERHENLVDACVEMIMKLYKEKYIK